MIECFNNIWILIICIYLFYLIIKKLYKMFINSNVKEDDTSIQTITSYYIEII
jgi:hypothetical protein